MFPVIYSSGTTVFLQTKLQQHLMNCVSIIDAECIGGSCESIKSCDRFGRSFGFYKFQNSSSEAVDHSIQARVSLTDHSQQVEHFAVNGCGVQTDIAQFQVDEIMLKLHDLQAKICEISFKSSNFHYRI